MYLEQEVYRTLFWAFIIVIVTSAAVISLFYIKTRKRSLLWFGGQLVFLSLSFRFFYRAITYLLNQANAMYSEDQSLRLGLAGLCWAISMLLMVAGIIGLNKGLK